MSLINDALARAKQIQPSQPPALPLRPIESPARAASATGSATGWIPWVLIVFLVIVAGTGFLAWQLGLKSRAEHQSQTLPTATPTIEAHARSASTPGQAAPAAVSAPASSSATVTAAAPVPATVATATSGVARDAENPDPAAIAAPSVPRLQAIVSHPRQPSAMISGKTVFVGDSIADYTVIAITPRTVTLGSPAGTRVLALE